MLEPIGRPLGLPRPCHLPSWVAALHRELADLRHKRVAGGGEGATWLESSGLRTTFTKCFTLGLSADLGGRLHGRFLSRLLCGRCCEFQRGFGCRLTGLARLGRIGLRNAFAWRIDKIVKYDFHGLLRGVCAVQIFLLMAARLCPSTLRLAF